MKSLKSFCWTQICRRPITAAMAAALLLGLALRGERAIDPPRAAVAPASTTTTAAQYPAPVVTGEIGSTAPRRRSATATSAARPKVWRGDQGEGKRVQAVVAAAGRAAQGRAECAAYHDRRLRLRHAEHVRRRHPNAGLGSHRQERTALHAVPLHVALLADARGPDHRPQSSRRPALASWAKRQPVIPGYDSVIRKECGTIGEILKENGYATSWFGKDHNTPFYQASQAGPFDQWPSGMGFEYFYGFVGGDTSQWQPNLFRNTTAIYPFQGKPGWNLTTAMADDAIQYIKQLKEIAPQQAVLCLLRSWRHARAAPSDAGVDQEDQRKAPVRWRLEQNPRDHLRQPEAARHHARPTQS